jgi:predicted HTH domain antitoxin
MYQLTLNLPEETDLITSKDLDSLRSSVLLAAAMKLFELEKLSSGAAASLAGIPRSVFLTKLADYDLSTFTLSENELLEDLANA